MPIDSAADLRLAQDDESWERARKFDTLGEWFKLPPRGVTPLDEAAWDKAKQPDVGGLLEVLMSFRTSIVVGTLLLACLTSPADGEQTVVRYDDGAGGQMWYRRYLPDNYDPDKSYPLTTFLHGNDGTNIKPVTDPDADVERAPQGLVDALASGPYESILIAPQLERGSWPSQNNDRLIHEAIEDVQATYGTDRQRRYSSATGSPPPTLK